MCNSYNYIIRDSQPITSGRITRGIPTRQPCRFWGALSLFRPEVSGYYCISNENMNMFTIIIKN